MATLPNQQTETLRPIPFRAHDYPEIVKAAESCVPEVIPDPDPEPEPEGTHPATLLRRKKRAAWIGDRGCTMCGSRRKLHIDHIDRSTKEMETGEVFRLSPQNPTAIRELAKCQILCERHHREKTARELRKKK